MQGFNAVIDLSHHNGSVDFKQVSGDGIVGVIHKATQGTTYSDPMYTPNKAAATSQALLWGAYHFGTGADGVAQAKYFLSVVQPTEQTLLVLDFEENTAGPSMTLDQARAFVTYVHDQTGRWPGFYSGSYVKGLLGTRKDPVLANCWFWLSQYGPTPVVQASWGAWTLWQYTDGNAGPMPHTVNGAGSCDRDTFNGTSDQLISLWCGSGTENQG